MAAASYSPEDSSAGILSKVRSPQMSAQLAADVRPLPADRKSRQCSLRIPDSQVVGHTGGSRVAHADDGSRLKFVITGGIGQVIKDTSQSMATEH